MLKHRHLPNLIAVLFGLAASVDAAALGFGRAPQTAVLGQPLDFAVPLRLEAGESVAAECLNAEVMVGENRIAQYLVRTGIEPAGADAAVVRVTTTPPVDEPVVTITITAGCTSRVSRRFMLLADPPLTAPVTAAPIVLAEAGTAPPSWTAATAAGNPGSTVATATTPAPSASASAPIAGSSRSTPIPGLRSDAATPRVSAKPAAAARPQRKPVARPAAAPVARLKLDVVEPVGATTAPPAAALIEEAIATVAEAASAARASAQAASAAARRIDALERDVQALRVQAQASRDEAASWRAQAQAASDAQRWSGALWLAVLLLAALSAWLAWRLRGQRQAEQRGWLQAAAGSSAASPSPAAAPVTAPIPLVISEIELPPSAGRPAWPTPVAVPSLQPAQVSAATPASPQARATEPSAAPLAKAAAAALHTGAAALRPGEITKVLTPGQPFDEGAVRDVSIEGLLDLEQQAEFFVALGQDDVAIDLLVEHLRSTGGGSPAPYLKLLDIYRRRDAPQAYERMRTRFNDRFNAYAPDWGSDLQSGRSLEEYPGIVTRLQQAWPRPLDAIALLEALLFRKSRDELFDLPAYREVLFLHALARDLLEHGPSESAQVDIVLPLAEGAASPPSSLPLPRSGTGADEPAGSRPTGPLDLDLSAPTTGSLFDDLSGSARPR